MICDTAIKPDISNITTTSAYLGSDNSITIYLDPEQILWINEIVPHKVYTFKFPSGKVIKTVCSDEDEFDLEYACYLAIAKLLYSYCYTFEGVLKKAEELKYLKRYNKIVKFAIKKFKCYQEQCEKNKEWEVIQKRKHEKLVARKIAKKERKRQEQITMIAEAIKLAKEEN